MSDWIRSLREQAVDGGARARAGLDMRTAASVIEAIENNRLMLFWEPVCSATDLGSMLYFECIVRLLWEDQKTIIYPGSFIPSLERLHMLQYLDRHVVGRVIDLLQTHSHLHLGVSVSAQSVSENAWCESLFLLLSTMPDVACRLLIGIGGTESLEAAPAHAFVRRLQQLGCRVAVDNFGAGYDVWTSMHSCSPDVVKIAGGLLVGNGDRRPEGDELARLVSLARDVAPCVVLKGVESACVLDMACDAGVDFVQGYYVGGARSLAVHVPQEPVCDSSTCDSAGTPGNEISLLPLAQLSKLVAQAELSVDAAESRSGAAVERTVQLLERNAGMIVDQSVCCKLRNHAKLAYLTGLTSSVYGKRSAIAATLRDEMAGVMRQEKCNPERSVQLLRCIGAFGRLHGQLIVCSFELDEAPGKR